MKTTHYQLDRAIDAVVFDCDCTLSAIEGINFLAEKNDVGEQVHALTELAMSEAGLADGIYKQRLSLVRPSRQQVVDLALSYFSMRASHVSRVIECFKGLGKAVYVVSAGINPAVKLFAAMLNIPTHHVFAVDCHFNVAGEYEGYDEASPCAQFQGKHTVAQRIATQYPRFVWVGDGMNDIAVKDDVVRFIGFGGYKYRSKVAELSDFYIKSSTMASLLPLVLTASEAEALSEADKQLYNEGMACLEAGEVE